MKLYQVEDLDGEDVGLYSTTRDDALAIIEQEIKDAFEENEQDEADIILAEREIVRVFVEQIFI